MKYTLTLHIANGSKSILYGIIILILFSTQQHSQNNEIPFEISNELFNHSDTLLLGLNKVPNSKTYTIYSPNDTTDKFSNGVVLIAFKNKLYAMWQSSSLDEDAEDTWVAYSISENGHEWSKPLVLAPKWDLGIYTSGGWLTDEESLVALINVWPKDIKPKGGYTEFIISTDGINWSDRQPVLDNFGKPILGIIEQDPHKLNDGKIICAFHEQPGLKITPYYTFNKLGIGDWTKGKMQNLFFEGSTSREMEPSWFIQNDGNIVMIFRDQSGTFKKLASISFDKGENWTTPINTNMPDSRSKQCAGNLPDGTTFMINNPNNNKNRFPLVITLSKDGKFFNQAFILRSGGSDLQVQKYKGKYKTLGYSYPKAFVWNDFLYVSYSTNKEDVEITEVPISSLNCN